MNKIKLFLFFLFLVAGLSIEPSFALALDRYWVGSAGGNTSDSANWSSSNPSSCTGGGASVPGASDTAIFDPDCDNNATVNAPLSITALNLNSGYSGTITVSDSLTTSGNITIDSGTISGTRNVTVNGGGVTGDGTINMTGATFLVDATGSFGGATGWTFYNLTFGDGAGSATTTATGSGAVTVSNAMTVAANQTLNAGSKTWNVTGTDVAESTVAVDGSSPVRWAGVASSGVGITSASFTAPANALLIACGHTDGISITETGWTPAFNDSGGLTWTERVTRTLAETTDGGASTIFTARTTSSVSRTVTWAPTWGGGFDEQLSAKLYVLTGVDIDGTPVDSVGANNEGGSATNNLTTSSITPGANGLLFACDTEWNALGVFDASSDLTQDTAHYAGSISVDTGYKTVTNGVGATANLNAAGSSAAHHKWTQVIVRAAPATKVFTNNGTFTAGTSTIVVNNTSSTAKTFVGNGATYNNITLSGNNVTISGNNTFATMAVNTAGHATGLIIGSGTTQTLTSFTTNGSSGSLAKISGVAGGGAESLSKSSGNVCVNYMNITDLTATGGASWYAGANSTNGGGNSGWNFQACPGANTKFSIRGILRFLGRIVFR